MTQKTPPVPSAPYRHKTATRRNAPTVETEPIMKPADRAPKPFTIDRREQVAAPVLAWDRDGETSTPQRR